MLNDTLLKFNGNIIANLPQCRDKDYLIDTYIPQNTTETCSWITSDNLNEDQINTFLKSAKKKGCSEEESLAHLMKNNYDCHKALESLVKTEQSNKLLNKNAMDVSNHFCKIIIGNRRFGRNRRRCFNKIRAEFPDCGMGDILDFYMRNKLKIKRKVAKYKRQIKKLNSLPSEEQYDKIIQSMISDYEEIKEEVKDESDDDCVIVSVSYEISDGWTEKDYQLLYHALTDYGYNYARLAAVIGTKTSAMIEQFIKQQQVV